MLCVSFSKKPSSWPLPPLLSLVLVPFFLLQCLVCLPVCLTCRKKSAASKAIHRILGRRRLSPSPSSFPSSSSSSLVSLLLVYCCSRSPNQTLCPRRSRYGVSVAAPACPGPRCVRCSALLCATVPNLPLPSSISSGFRTARPAAAPSLAQQLHSVIRPSPCFSATLSTPTPRSKIPLSADTAAHTPWSIIFPYPRPRVPPIVPRPRPKQGKVKKKKLLPFFLCRLPHYDSSHDSPSDSSPPSSLSSSRFSRLFPCACFGKLAVTVTVVFVGA
ncbi:hypothetical protein B0J15DRAFT_2565 [Fusarium solani]|uniref:Uncharacterized protein n=1 Tax=Fusarium solani TaxID=169388 RepID=A0A9P9RED4_FUSSL|nr:uncharacterized protein B0J15DRAFT_2565 [Fusarium solani]KAH7274990.1 hypothetical protein B0J15DRAFT_2565 [Fusarium solani]